LKENHGQGLSSVFGADPQDLTLAYEYYFSAGAAGDCGIEYDDKGVFTEIEQVGKPVMLLDMDMAFHVGPVRQADICFFYFWIFRFGHTNLSIPYPKMHRPTSPEGRTPQFGIDTFRIA
jgi:hypothetical protein